MIATIVASSAATPEGGTLTPVQRSVRWAGDPVTGAASGPEDCSEVSCDEFALTVDIGSSFWERPGGGVVVRIEWVDPQNDLDLHIYDPAGQEVAHSYQISGTFEEAFLSAPARGTYSVLTVGFDGAAVSYAGRASITSAKSRAVHTSPNSMRFSAPTIVDPQIAAAEPGVLTSPGGQVYIHALTALESLASHVWRSEDGARTFELLDSRLADSFSDPRRGPCSDAIGGGDADVIVDRTGRLYFLDLEALNVNVATSTDGGDSWTCNALAASTPLDDRPWLAPAATADGSGPNIDAYLAYTDSGTSAQPFAKKIKPFEIHLEVTYDGGNNWVPRRTYARSLIHTPGRLFTAPDGTLYHAFAGENAVWAARSRDAGTTFELVKVSQRIGSPGNIFIAGDADEAGNVFIAWADSGTFDVLYSSSTDQGAHWSSPVRLNPPSSETAVLPWVAAGRGGDVAIAWYGTAAPLVPDSASPSTRWNAWVARSRDATRRAPAFQIARLSETSMHFGPICLGGQSCTENPERTRSLADFFQIDIARDGAIVATFNDNGRIQDTAPQPYVVVARQIAGLGMPSGSASVAHLRERKGDALFPPHSKEGRSVPALDFMAAPGVSLRGDTLQLSFTLDSARDLDSALTATSAGVATAAMWLVTWKANDRVEYAAMTTDTSGATSFFGGDQPGGASDHRLYPYLTYPQQFPLRGRVDTARGQVTIDVPLAQFHLKPGDVLHGLQAFSLAGVPQAASYLSSQLVDMTPSQTLRIGAAGPSSERGRRTPPETKRGRMLPATGVGDARLALCVLAVAAGLALWRVGPRRSRRRPRIAR